MKGTDWVVTYMEEGEPEGGSEQSDSEIKRETGRERDR